MALRGRRVTVGTTATRVDSVETAQNVTLMIRNRSTVSMYLGGSDVTTAAGYEVGAGENLTIRGKWTDIGAVYAIAGTAGNRLDVLQVTS